MLITKYLDLAELKVGWELELLEVVLLSAVSFLVPFLIGHPQIVVGIIVNSALVLAALHLKSWKLAPVVLLPSLGALSRGLLFGPFTPALVYMVPFIWVGNGFLVYVFKFLRLGKKWNYFVTLGFGAVVKAVFLFIVAFVLFRFGKVPQAFLLAMGPVQLGTALGGGVLGLLVNKVLWKWTECSGSSRET